MPSTTVAQRISTLKQLIDSYENKKSKKDIASEAVVAKCKSCLLRFF